MRSLSQETMRSAASGRVRPAFTIRWAAACASKVSDSGMATRLPSLNSTEAENSGRKVIPIPARTKRRWSSKEPVSSRTDS